MGFLDDLFGSEQTTDTSYNKNTNQQFSGQSNQTGQYNPYAALYSQYALQQGQPGIMGTQGTAQPYYNQAGNYFGQSAQMPDTASFYNPFAANVMANMQDVFGSQMKQMTGNLAQQAGGVGADRIAVGQSELAKQQGLAAGQTMAGIYGQAQQAAAQQRAQQYQAGAGYAGLGTAAQNAALQPYQALGQFTAGVAPGMGAAQSAQANQYGQMTGTESGTGHSVTESDPSTWSDLMNIGSFAGKMIAPRPSARGGRINPYATGGSVGDLYHGAAMRGVRSLGLHDPRHYARGGPGHISVGRNTWDDSVNHSLNMAHTVHHNFPGFPGGGPANPYADGGDVDSFADRFGAADDAVANGVFDPQFENGSRWADDPGGDDPVSAYAAREPRPTTDVLEGEVLPPEKGPPMAPWKPAPYEDEVNPYASARKPDRSSLPGLLESLGVISPETSDTIGRFGERLGEAALAGQGVQGATAAAQLPLQRRSLDQQQSSLTMRAREAAIQAARQQQALEETMRHNRENEKYQSGRLDQENWTNIGPSEDGKGTVFLNRRSGETKIEPIAVAGKTKPIPASLQKDLGTQSGSYHALSSLESGFKDEYGGSTFSKVGDLQNWIARNAGIGNTDAADWWQEYQRYKNGVRHGLFGSALTANEISEWEKSDITPGMQPDRIKANIKHQRDVVESALQRRALSLSKQGYSKEAIEAEMGMKIGEGGAPAAPGKTPETKTLRTIKQGGWLFQEQPDGSMKPLQQVGQ